MNNFDEFFSRTINEGSKELFGEAGPFVKAFSERRMALFQQKKLGFLVLATPNQGIMVLPIASWFAPKTDKDIHRMVKAHEITMVLMGLVYEAKLMSPPEEGKMYYLPASRLPFPAEVLPNPPQTHEAFGPRAHIERMRDPKGYLLQISEKTGVFEQAALHPNEGRDMTGLTIRALTLLCTFGVLEYPLKNELLKVPRPLPFLGELQEGE